MAKNWKPKFVLVGTATYLGATAAAYFHMRGRPSTGDSEHTNCGCCNSNVLRQAVDNMAPTYDDQIGMDETLMGVGLIRRWMLRDIKGSVLEVGCGTGRNLDYYNSESKVTAIDLSERMLAVAKTKVDENGIKNVSLGIGDAQSLPYEDSSFDVVVDTFGLCSYPDPSSVVNEMQRVCRRDGTIILIEHGRSHYDWLNGMLDGGADAHARTWGCWWNRPIDTIVEGSGVDINSIWRWHFGTTYVITAQPKK